MAIDLEDIMKRKLTNVQSLCPLCGYDKNKKIISKTYFKIFNRIEVPKFVFVNFEFIDENEYELSNNLEVEHLSFIKRIKYNNEITKFLLSEHILFKKKYCLIGAINTPESNHYNGIILNLNISYQNLELGKNYIYDGNKNSNSILKIDNLNKTLLKNNPYIGLFIKLD